MAAATSMMIFYKLFEEGGKLIRSSGEQSLQRDGLVLQYAGK